MASATTHYARSGQLYIAYQTIGEGEVDLVVIDQWSSNIEAGWDFPPIARLLTRLSTFARVIIFDKRGVGLSDPVSIDALPTLEEWIDDLRAVLDAAGSTRPALLAAVGGSFMALVFAATYPERTSGLVLVDPFTRLTAAPDYPIGLPAGRLATDLDRLAELWGVTGSMTFLAPNLVGEHPLAEQFNRYERLSASPGAARAMIGMIYDSDVRHVLPAIRVPTLVMHHRDAVRIKPDHGRYVADRIEGARYLEIPGVENYVWAGDWETVADETEEFLTGARP
ncbi:MAG TPA: alpha/beta hydrolase, partial [Candidatus Limnocylindrales bacterium]|nr:alpha/beta hydrolase [Candidatus Limnocylindrales bacterium]